ncbi:MAG: type IX secretion system membrane protein PorP/SprF [Bacteroidota bacterium]
MTAFSGWRGQEFRYNPGMTSTDRQGRVYALYQQEWSGFEDAPLTIQLGGQLPVKNQPFSLGAYLEIDHVLPLRQNTLGFTYAYHLGGYGRGLRGGNRTFLKRTRAQLSLGVGASFQQIFLDPTQLVLTDAGDQALPAAEVGLNVPIFDAGLLYSSVPGGPLDQSYAFVGLGFRQIMSQRLELRPDAELSGLLNRSPHGNIVVGYQFLDENLLVRSQLWISLADNAPGETQLSVDALLNNSLSAAFSYRLSQTLALRFGYVLPQGDDGTKNIKLGLQGVFNLGAGTAVRGLGYSFFIAYEFGNNSEVSN